MAVAFLEWRIRLGRAPARCECEGARWEAAAQVWIKVRVCPGSIA